MTIVTVKAVFVGDGAVGKTTMLMRFVTKEFPMEYIPTVFDNYYGKTPLKDCVVGMGLWDTGGGEDYPRLRPLCYPKTNVFPLSFAVNNRGSFDHVENYWLPELQHHCPDVPIVLIGTKIDLRDDAKQEEDFVSKEEGMEMMVRIGAVEYHEISSLTGYGVEELFDRLAIVGAAGKKNKDPACKVS